MAEPQVFLSPLNRADGSATYSLGGYSVIAAVNGPVEVQRRDELPEEAAIEVNVRPAVGVGSPKERHLESIISSTLRHVILTHAHPRTLIQVTLQILSTPEEEADLRSSNHLSVLAPLLQASLLALLAASIPLSMTFHATSVAIGQSRKVTVAPTPKDLMTAASAHVFAFSSKGDLLVAESEGTFDMDEWDLACGEAKKVCCKTSTNGADDEAMDEDGMTGNLQDHAYRAIESQVEKARAWKVAG